jgi:hypothetical protein
MENRITTETYLRALISLMIIEGILQLVFLMVESICIQAQVLKKKRTRIHFAVLVNS